MKSYRYRVLTVVLIVVIALVAVAFVWELTRPYHSPGNPIDQFIDSFVDRTPQTAPGSGAQVLVISPDELEEKLKELGIDPEDALVYDVERQSYAPAMDMAVEEETFTLETPEEAQQADVIVSVRQRVMELCADESNLVLYIPAIGFAHTVGSGTTMDALALGPGLYEVSSLPAEGDVNVAIAGHRDNYGSHFYYLDKIVAGDYAYLIYKGQVYRYLFSTQNVVEPDDWSLITKQGRSCLTLTTCTPLGVADHRLVVQCVLEDVSELTEDYNFYMTNY